MKLLAAATVLLLACDTRLEVPNPPAPLRVGGDVVAPVIVRRVDPVYPKDRGTYRQGILVLECVITATGEVHDLRVVKGPGNSFEQAILDAVKQWKFKPGSLHGKPVAVIYNLSVNHVPYEPGG
jgi:TonB family protein